MAGGIGIAILLALVAAGVALFLIYGMRLSRFEYVEKEVLTLACGVAGIVEKRRADYEPTFRTGITGGVVLCVVAVVPLMVTSAFFMDGLFQTTAWNALLVLVAVGVHLLVRECWGRIIFFDIFRMAHYNIPMYYLFCCYVEDVLCE